MLAEKLNMNPEEAECWIVNLIRNARLDAKIDSKLGHVVMGTQPLSPYQQLLEKIDTLSVRSEALQQLIERKVKAKTQEVNIHIFLTTFLPLNDLHNSLFYNYNLFIYSKIHYGTTLEKFSVMVKYKQEIFSNKTGTVFVKCYFTYLFSIIKIIFYLIFLFVVVLKHPKCSLKHPNCS